MPKILVLAEKPSVGKELARVLGCRKMGAGFISGDKYIVTWALGHLVTLEDPEHYGEQYAKWSMDTLPMLPSKMDLKVIKETSKQYKAVKDLLHSKEISSLIIATDAGREGELVARWIIEKAGFKKPIKRLWISSQTEKAIKQGFNNLREGKEYYNLYQSAKSRAEADWIVGLNVTRALACKYNAQLSAGRVQTPTLALIVRREEDIRKFVPKDYYTISGDLDGFFATWHDDKNQTGIFDKSRAELVLEKVKDRALEVKDTKVTPKKILPPMLYDLTELQRDANKLYQMSPKETLSVMQRLYENHKALTYPRTDSRYITDDIVPTLYERLKAINKGDFVPLVSDITRNKMHISKSCVNNAKVSDHHAIIPTEQGINMANLTSNEKRIYMLVVKRFITCFYPAYEYNQTRAEFLCEGERFYAVGRVVTNKGWKKVYDNNDDLEENEQTLPQIKKGSKYKCRTFKLNSHKTTPPPRYTEASLLSAMENPAKFIEDKGMKDYLSAGLGTPATRADIIEKLFSSFYIEKQGSSLRPTPKGIQLISLVPTDLKEPLMTAKWEEQLEKISKGKQNRESFVSQIKDYTTTLIKTVDSSEDKYVHHNITKTECPQCGKYMLSVNGKKGKMLVCEDRNCGFRQNVSFVSNTRCPNCHKKMEMIGDKEKRSYTCLCGFRERVDRFHEKVGGKDKASKQLVQKYMNSQKEDKGESALAKALLEALNKTE